MKLPYKNGFTLVELMVAMVVGSIAIASAYASYDVIAKQYEKVKGVTAMQSSSRSIMRMIERDIRMAGFKWRNSKGTITFGSISEPIKFTDSGNKCCDAVTVTYDYRDETSKKVERHKIHYAVKPYQGRNRLYRKRDILFPKARPGNNDVLADYVEDLQFDFEMTQGTGAGILWQQTMQLLKDIHAAQKNYRSKHGKYYANRGCRRYSGRGGCYNKFGRNASGWWSYENPEVKRDLFGGVSPLVDSKSSRGNQNWNVSTFKFRSGYVAYVTWWGAAEDYCAGYNPTPNAFSPKSLINTTKITGEMRKRPNHSVCPCHSNYRTNCNRGAWINEQGQITVRQSNWWQTNPKGHGPYAKETASVLASPLVGINLILRTKKEFGFAQTYKKKDYYEGNYDINKNDAYKRQEYSSTVLIRNPL